MPDIHLLQEALEILLSALSSGALSSTDAFSVASSPGVSSPILGCTALAGGKPLAVLAVVSPDVAAKSSSFLEFLARKARAQRTPYMVAWSLREAALRETPRLNVQAVSVEPLRDYPTLFEVTPATVSPLSNEARQALQAQGARIVHDLAILHQEGRLDMVLPDATFFVKRLTDAVKVLKPHLKDSLAVELRLKVQFARELERWAIEQGIPADLQSDEFLEAVTRQAIYRLLGKVIFYQSLRRSVRSLPELDLTGMDSSFVMPTLRRAFAEALQVDYHAVFAEVMIDDLPYPADAAKELAALVEDLNTRDFAGLPQDVVGQVFEQLIPREDRRGLGQFFTPEPLADLICAFCIRTPDDRELDPTMGTGTFLLRAYDRLHRGMGVQEHAQLLSQLWGVDIAPFPAELATINLFRQRVDEHGNFPRTLCQDFIRLKPGQFCRFPPLKAAAEQPSFVDEPVPQFDAIVGNFPYIGGGQIERQEAGYLATIRRTIAEDWFLDAPELFTIPDRHLRADYEKQRQAGRDLSSFIPHAEPSVSTHADFYVYLFFHSARFLVAGGRMGIVTSNAWLDVDYGYALQRFFLGHFKIVAILESRCEPWFEDAAVNTVVTIVERCDDETARESHSVRFVRVKKRLDELVPQDMRTEASARWQRLDDLVDRIERQVLASDDSSRPATYEDADLRIRAVRQGVLRAQVATTGQTVKWGPYLRAPDVYFDLIRGVGCRLVPLGELAPPTRGSMSGINEFYYLNEGEISERGVESEFLFPLLKSPGESPFIPIDEGILGHKVFVCRLSKDELRSRGKLGALRHIEWGERQAFSDGRPWPQGSTVRDRQPGWYALPESHSRPAQVFLTKAYHDRHLLHYSTQPLIADQRLYFLSPVGGVSEQALAAVMNSSLTAFSTEVNGRVTLGEGVLELAVEDAREYLLVPDVRQFNPDEQRDVVTAFQPLLGRSIGSVFDEVTRPDRQALDRAVLMALKLDADVWLPRLYEGLTSLVRERTELGRMRSKARRSNKVRATSDVGKQVQEIVFPDGPRHFPDDFWSEAARQGSFREVALPATPLRYAGHSFGREDVIADGGFQYQAHSKAEVKYLIYTQRAGQSIAHLPVQMVELTRSVANYERYIREKHEELYTTYRHRTLDQKAATRFVENTLQQLGLTLVEGL